MWVLHDQILHCIHLTQQICESPTWSSIIVSILPYQYVRVLHDQISLYISILPNQYVRVLHVTQILHCIHLTQQICESPTWSNTLYPSYPTNMWVLHDQVSLYPSYHTNMWESFMIKYHCTYPSYPTNMWESYMIKYHCIHLTQPICEISTWSNTLYRSYLTNMWDFYMIKYTVSILPNQYVRLLHNILHCIHLTHPMCDNPPPQEVYYTNSELDSLCIGNKYLCQKMLWLFRVFFL